MDFRFAAAADLYAADLHPRLYFGPDDLPALRSRVSRGVGKKLFEALRQRVAPYIEAAVSNPVDEPLNQEALSARWTPENCLLRASGEVAFIFRMTEDPRAFQALHRLFNTLVHREHAGTAVAFDLMHDHLDPALRSELRRLLLADARAHVARHGDSYYSKPARNMTIDQTLPAILNLLAIRAHDDASETDADLVRLISFLDATMQAQLGRDGYPEEDMGYGSMEGGRLAMWSEPLRRAGLYDPYTAGSAYPRFGRAMLHMVQPWGQFLSNTGDHGDDFREREFVLGRLAKETNDPCLIWLLKSLTYPPSRQFRGDASASAYAAYWREVELRPGEYVPASMMSILVMDQLRGGRHPSRANVPTQFRERARGIVSLRSSWQDDATLLLFDAAQRNPGASLHFHASAGHFSITALGEYFAIDSGRYGLDQDQHNVMLVNGVSGHTRGGQWWCTNHSGVLTGYQPGSLCDSASADSTAQSNGEWARRTVGLVKDHRRRAPRDAPPAYVWTADDVCKDVFAEHDYWWTLNTSPENVIRLYRRHASIRGCRYGNEMDVHVFCADRADDTALALDQDENLTSSSSYITNPHERAAALPEPRHMVHGPVYVRPRLIARSRGKLGRLVALMLPRRKGASRAKVRRLPSLPNSVAVTIDYGSTMDTLIHAWDHRLLEADGIVARGQWVLVRTSGQSGRLLSWELGEGARLVVDGKVMVGDAG